MTIITLSNGKKVGNFSSPHPFTFEDGSILPAVSNEEAERLKVDFVEIDMGDGDVCLDFKLSDAVFDEMYDWQKLYEKGEVDVVFCPLPMIINIGNNVEHEGIKSSPFRAVRMEDRIKKLVSIHKQCI